MELSRLVVVEESDEALLASARSRRIDLTGRRMYHMDGRFGLAVPAPGDVKLLQRLQTRPQVISTFSVLVSVLVDPPPRVSFP
jgi:hypothetical protein